MRSFSYNLQTRIFLYPLVFYITLLYHIGL